MTAVGVSVRNREDADAHVREWRRHLDWCADQWALSNGITVIAECGTVMNWGEDDQ